MWLCGQEQDLIINKLSFQFLSLDENRIKKFLIQVSNHVVGIDFSGCAVPNDLVIFCADIFGEQLEFLSLYWNPMVSDKAIMYLTSHCFNLKVLNLSGVRYLSDTAIENAARCCLQLEELDLTRLDQLTDASLHAIARGCRKLRKLNLYASGKFTDKGFCDVFEHCLELEEVDICGSRATDESIEALSMNCKNLQTLNLRWCTALTDLSLMCLSRLERLKYLNIHGIASLTQEGLEHLGNANVKWTLETLDINGCIGIHMKTIDELRGLFPNLRRALKLD